mmetsp:Transcript_2596/g.4606  ORF Transcript_2596/g.4606 Transcript_2596/m.4606 type:complete len:96 (-) Transcript_2596:2083-2370(-)
MLQCAERYVAFDHMKRTAEDLEGVTMNKDELRVGKDLKQLTYMICMRWGPQEKPPSSSTLGTLLALLGLEKSDFSTELCERFLPAVAYVFRGAVY